jgi:hypothetical protein
MEITGPLAATDDPHGSNPTVDNIQFHNIQLHNIQLHNIQFQIEWYEYRIIEQEKRGNLRFL